MVVGIKLARRVSRLAAVSSCVQCSNSFVLARADSRMQCSAVRADAGTRTRRMKTDDDLHPERC